MPNTVITPEFGHGRTKAFVEREIVTFKKRPMSSDGSRVERRKTNRFPVVVPIEVTWRGPDGIEVKEDAAARQVNANGGFLKMSAYPELGTRVTLTNFLSGRTAEARVIAEPNAREGVANGIVIELIVPDELFWGVDLQVKKTIVELQNLEKALRCEEMDLRLVKEYRDSVDLIRKAAQALEQLREHQFRELDNSDLLSALAADRIRRTINLCRDLQSDFYTGRVKQSQDNDELRQALENLAAYLRQHAHLGASSDDSKQPRWAATIPMSRKS